MEDGEEEAEDEDEEDVEGDGRVFTGEEREEEGVALLLLLVFLLLVLGAVGLETGSAFFLVPTMTTSLTAYRITVCLTRAVLSVLPSTTRFL